EVAQRICDDLRLAPAVLRRPAAHAAAGHETPRLPGPRAEERVARPRLAAHHGLEQEAEARGRAAPLALARRTCQLPVGGDGGVRVEEELAPDGHEVGAGGEPCEVVEIGMEHGNKCRSTGPACQTPTQRPSTRARAGAALPPYPSTRAGARELRRTLTRAAITPSSLPSTRAARSRTSSACATAPSPASSCRRRRRTRRRRSSRGFGGCWVPLPLEKRARAGAALLPRPSTRAGAGELRGERRAGTFVVRMCTPATNLRPPPPGRGRGRSLALALALALARSS